MVGIARRQKARDGAARERALLDATLRLVRADLAAERDAADALVAREAELVLRHDAAVHHLRALAVQLQLDAPASAGPHAHLLDDLDAVIVALARTATPEEAAVPVAEFVAELRAVTTDAAAAAGLRPAVSWSGPLDRVPPLVARQLHASLRAALVDVLHRGARSDTTGRTLAVDVTATDTGVTLTVADETDPAPATVTTPDDERAARLGGWCVRHRTATGGALVWHVPFDRGLARDPRDLRDPDATAADLVVGVVGELTARLAVSHGADRLAVAGDAIRTAVDASGYCVLVLVDAGAHVEVVRAAGYPDDPSGTVLPADRSVAGHVIRTGRPVRIATVAEVPVEIHHVDLPVGRVLVVPLRLAAASAALVLTREAGAPAFGTADEDAAVTLAAVVSAMLELQPVQDVIDTWPAAEFDYTASNPGRGFPFAVGPTPGGPTKA